jgi:uncharacterized protein YuzE
MKKSKLYYDKKSDNLYLFVKEGQLDKYHEVAPGIAVELDKNGQLLGIEILRASKVLGETLRVNKTAFNRSASQI